MCGRLTVVSQSAGGGSARRRSMRAARQRQRGLRRRIGLDPAGRGQARHRDHAGAREVGDVVDALERLPGLLGHRDRHGRDRDRGKRQQRQRDLAADRGTDRCARSATARARRRCAASSSGSFSRGKTDSRKEKVSRSMIRKSRKVIESCRMSNLKRENAISTTVAISDSAAAMPGRGSNSSTRQLANSQASSDSVIANGPYSVVKQRIERAEMQRSDAGNADGVPPAPDRTGFPSRLGLAGFRHPLSPAKGSSQSPPRSAGG